MSCTRFLITCAVYFNVLELLEEKTRVVVKTKVLDPVSYVSGTRWVKIYKMEILNLPQRVTSLESNSVQ